MTREISAIVTNLHPSRIRLSCGGWAGQCRRLISGHNVDVNRSPGSLTQDNRPVVSRLHRVYTTTCRVPECGAGGDGCGSGGADGGEGSGRDDCGGVGGG